MNELARVVHDLVTGEHADRVDLTVALAVDERAAFEELRSVLQKAPSKVAALLAHTGPTGDWYDPPNSAAIPTKS